MPDPNLKWRVQLCMSIPHLHPPIIHAGLHGIISNKGKILFAVSMVETEHDNYDIIPLN